MSKILDTLGASWIGTLVGIAGILIGLILYRRSRLGGYIAFQTRGSRLIGSSGSQLEGDVTVQFRGETVPRITLSEIAFWNAGYATLRGADIAERDPIRATLGPSSKILRLDIVAVTRDVCGISVTDQGHELQFSFDFLDPGDGARLEVLHTDTCRHLDLEGTIRGAPKSVRDWGVIRPTVAQIRVAPSGRQLPLGWLMDGRIPRIAYFMGLSGILMMAAAFLTPHLRAPWITAERRDWFWLAIGGIYTSLGALMFSMRHKFPRALDTDSKSAPSAKDGSARRPGHER